MNKITNYYYNELKYSEKLVNYVLYKFVCRQLANCARKSIPIVLCAYPSSSYGYRYFN